MELIEKNYPISLAKYECTICLKSFVEGSSLEEHVLQKHVNHQKFQCTTCFQNKQLVKSFATQHLLNSHIKRVHDPPRFKCPICFKTFRDSSNFANHKRRHSHTNIKIHKCDLCSQAFRLNNRLQIHLFHAHKQRRENVNYFKCEICSREFVSRSKLELHVIRQHVVDKDFECRVCSKKFIDQQTLEKHMKRHDRQIEYFCHLCSKGFIWKKSLLHHLGVSHSLFFYCDKCCNSYKNKSNFDAHISDSNQELKCYICKEIINSECNFKIHTDSHVKEIKTEKNKKVKPKYLSTSLKTVESSKEKNTEKLKCDVCSQTFDRETYFRAHRNLVHPNAEWKCNFEKCIKTFKMYYQLKLHKMEHGETKEFVCNICQKSFYRPDHLRKHEQLHLKEKKYKCELCPKSFVASSPLRAHIASSHGGVKPLKCPFLNCETNWANNSQLNSHLVSHKTEKLYECELCPAFKAFKSHGQLQIHQRRVHLASDTNKTETCKKSLSTKFSDAVVFICSSNSCSFETTSHTEVALHYNEQHQLPKVLLLKNFVSPATLNDPKKFQETSKIIQKQFKCGICWKLFKLAPNFSLHQFAHTEEVPFECSVCFKSFKCKPYLSRHVRKMHLKKSKGIKGL